MRYRQRGIASFYSFWYQVIQKGLERPYGPRKLFFSVCELLKSFRPCTHQTSSTSPPGYKTLYLKSYIASYLLFLIRDWGQTPYLRRWTTNTTAPYCWSRGVKLEIGLNNTTVQLLRLAKTFYGYLQDTVVGAPFTITLLKCCSTSNFLLNSQAQKSP